MTDKELHNLIIRYFEAETSLDEERMLRKAIAEHSGNDTMVDEARAVMGFSLASGASESKRKDTTGKVYSPATFRQIAAAIATCAIIGGASMLTMNNAGNDYECVAYLNGKKISDERDVMQLMLADLTAMETASAELSTEISDDFSEISLIMSDMH